MTGKIIHAIVFIIVATIVTLSFVNVDPDDAVRAAGQLPVLLLAGLYLGVMFVLYVLPALTQRATNAVLASNEQVERDPLRDARAAMARGDYEDAIEFYREAAEANPLDRLPWVEIAKIQHDQLEDPEAAIQTLSDALEEQEWADDDIAFYMVRIAEIKFQDLEQPEEAAAMLNKIIELFPGSRHSANATHKLRELDLA